MGEETVSPWSGVDLLMLLGVSFWATAETSCIYLLLRSSPSSSQRNPALIGFSHFPSILIELSPDNEIVLRNQASVSQETVHPAEDKLGCRQSFIITSLLTTT